MSVRRSVCYKPVFCQRHYGHANNVQMSWNPTWRHSSRGKILMKLRISNWVTPNGTLNIRAWVRKNPWLSTNNSKAWRTNRVVILILKPTGCANENNPLQKMLYFNYGSIYLSQTCRLCVWIFTQYILQIFIKITNIVPQISSLNFKVHFFMWTCSCTLNMHE